MRLVPAQLQRQRCRLRSSTASTTSAAGIHGRADAAPSRRRHRHRRGLRRRRRSATPASRSPTRARWRWPTTRCMLGVEDFTPGASGFIGETDKGGAVDNGGIVTPTGNTFPTVTVPAGVHDPAADAVRAHGQRDRRARATRSSTRGSRTTAAAQRARRSSTTRRLNGPLFAMFPKSAPISETDTLLYNSPNENHVTTSPTRVFPDLKQILANNTNADTGTCPRGADRAAGADPGQGVLLGVPADVRLRRLRGREPRAAATAALPAHGARPAARRRRQQRGRPDPDAGTGHGSVPRHRPELGGRRTRAARSQTVTWDKANTDLPPIGTTDVKISLSTDGGLTYPIVLAASTANDGSEAVTIPNVATR